MNLSFVIVQPMQREEVKLGAGGSPGIVEFTGKLVEFLRRFFGFRDFGFFKRHTVESKLATTLVYIRIEDRPPSRCREDAKSKIVATTPVKRSRTNKCPKNGESCHREGMIFSCRS